MLNTTLCYVTRGSQVLMLHRVKKKADINKDKWIGIGGKFENEESPDECLLREAKEETGLTLTSWQCRGVVTFLNDCCEGEYMYLFTADGFTGEMIQCNEGDLQWVEREFLDTLPKWEGDQIFLDLLWQNASFFLLLSVFPIVSLLLSLLPYTPLPIAHLLGLCAQLAPEWLLRLLEYFIRTLYKSSSAAIISASVVLTLWSAS